MLKVYKAIIFKKEIKKYKHVAWILTWLLIHRHLKHTACVIYCSQLLHIIIIKCCTTSVLVQILRICWCFHAYTELVHIVIIRISLLISYLIFFQAVRYSLKTVKSLIFAPSKFRANRISYIRTFHNFWQAI